MVYFVFRIIVYKFGGIIIDFDLQMLCILWAITKTYGIQIKKKPFEWNVVKFYNFMEGSGMVKKTK